MLPEHVSSQCSLESVESVEVVTRSLFRREDAGRTGAVCDAVTHAMMLAEQALRTHQDDPRPYMDAEIIHCNLLSEDLVEVKVKVQARKRRS